MKHIYFFLLVNLIATSLFATHNKAGEIHYKQISEKTIQCYIITYTEPSSVPADRDTLEINFGDGTSEKVQRSNGNGDGNILNSRYKHNIYITQHTYSDFGEYTLSVFDRNRNYGIVNLGGANSGNIAFYIFNTFTLDEEFNSAPQSLLPPVAVGSVFTPFEHVAASFDTDGDRLTYKLVTPKGVDGEDVQTYQEVTNFTNGSPSQISLHPVTGYLVWDSPSIAGQYNIAIEVTSWRNGTINGKYIRDMVIDIANEPIPVPLIDQTDLPAFATTQQVNVGDTIKYTIMATSQNFLDSLFVSSGLFDLSEQPAIFNKTVSTAFEQSGDFFWIVDESHVREEEYSLAVQIIDDNLVSGFYLVNFEVNDIGTSTAAHPEEEHDIIIYSNPVKDVLNIKSKSRNFSDYQIFDMLGTLMIHGKLDGKSVGTRLLPSGSYVLLIDGKYSLQFIKVE